MLLSWLFSSTINTMDWHHLVFLSDEAQQQYIHNVQISVMRESYIVLIATSYANSVTWVRFCTCCVCVCVCVCLHVCACQCVCMHMCVNGWVCMCACACVYAYISAYDKDQNLSGHSLFLTNSMKFPLMMYSQFVWPNLIWPDICLFWPKNVW